jgi:hypothetical protein
MRDVTRRALKLTNLSLVWAKRCNEAINQRHKFGRTLTKIRSCTRLAIPRLATTKRRVMGPGIPSPWWSTPTLFAISSSATPPGPFIFSSDSSVAPEPATSCAIQTIRRSRRHLTGESPVRKSPFTSRQQTILF